MARETIVGSGPRISAGCSILSLLSWALALGLIGCAGSVHHDEALAAKRALEFAKVVLIEKDFAKGHAMLSDGGKRHIPLDKLKQTVASMHPQRPEQVTALEFEPISAKRHIFFFLGTPAKN